MKIADNVYVLDSTKGSYAYLITGDENILIDTCLSFKGKSILKELISMGIKPESIKHILLTHHDLDHIGNVCMLQQLSGAKVWASAEDTPYITGELERYGFKKYLGRIMKVQKPKALEPYTDGLNINGIEIIPAPGHTPGHVCLLYRDILFAGDLLENKKGKLRPYPKPWNWDDAIMLESINMISRLKFEWVCPAHGEPVHISSIY